LLIFFFITKNNNVNENDTRCKVDTDCFPISCCHAQSCVIRELKPDCNGVFCTEECSGPLDCGRGYCGCINDKCSVITNE